MPDLTPITPLGGTTLREDRIGAITITEADDWALASVAARAGQLEDTLARVRKLSGLDLPGPGGLVAGGDWRAWWMAPEAWMLATPLSASEDIVAAVKPALGDAASITEQTDAWARFDITAPVGFLERLCNVDPARVTPGTATRTVMEHMGVVVLRHGDQAFSVLGVRSSAGSLHHALLTAARAVA